MSQYTILQFFKKKTVAETQRDPETAALHKYAAVCEAVTPDPFDVRLSCTAVSNFILFETATPRSTTLLEAVPSELRAAARPGAAA